MVIRHRWSILTIGLPSCLKSVNWMFLVTEGPLTECLLYLNYLHKTFKSAPPWHVWFGGRVIWAAVPSATLGELKNQVLSRFCRYQCRPCPILGCSTLNFFLFLFQIWGSNSQVKSTFCHFYSKNVYSSKLLRTYVVVLFLVNANVVNKRIHVLEICVQ